MQNSKLFLILIASLIVFQECEAVTPAALKAIHSLLNKIFGNAIKNTATQINDKIEKNLGQDVSIGDIESMNVEMVRVVEPYSSQAIVTDFMGNKAAFLLSTLRPLKSTFMGKKKNLKQYPTAQYDLNELIGIFMVLNESDSAAAEALLSAQPCLLSREDYHFKRVANPCHNLSEEIMVKIIERFDEIESFRKHFNDASVKISGEWDSHWRQIIGRLDQYASTVLNSKSLPRWLNIKSFIENQEKK